MGQWDRWDREKQHRSENKIYIEDMLKICVPRVPLSQTIIDYRSKIENLWDSKIKRPCPRCENTTFFFLFSEFVNEVHPTTLIINLNPVNATHTFFLCSIEIICNHVFPTFSVPLTDKKSRQGSIDFSLSTFFTPVFEVRK